MTLAVPVDAQAPPVQRVDVQFSGYGLGGFGGRIRATNAGTRVSADLPASFGGGARAGIIVPHAGVALQAEVSPIKPKGARERHRTTSVLLIIAGRHRVRLGEDTAIEPYVGIGAGVALYDFDTTIVSGRALQASIGLNLFFRWFGGFVELGWQRFDLGGFPDDESVFPEWRPGTNTDIHFNRAQVRIGLLAEL